MTALLTETRERFLKYILAQVPSARIAEIHFFQPIRQSGTESGVAVVVERADAATPLPPDAEGGRIVVRTARYRLTLKGLDRGKWETNIRADADAPFDTVNLVVRGVQQRAGDVDDATRMDGDEVRAIDVAWNGTAAAP